MGTIAKEAGVLKLVRPGRRVELHKAPITAAEVISRYPRHSITRPDIFEFPWIVVKPEAVLCPGRVFFIVPNRTIYQLLKARENSDSDKSSSSASQPQQQQGSPKDHAQQPVSKKTSPPNKAYAGMTPKHQEHRRRLKHQFLTMSCSTSVCPSEEEEETDKELRRDVQRGSGPVLLGYRTSQGEPKRKSSSMNSKSGSRTGKGKDSINSIIEKLNDLKFTTSKQVPMLKSCIRKPESARKLLRLKVKFDLPDDYVERQSKGAGYRMQFPDFIY